MNQREIKHLQERIGTIVDGDWGELSTRAAREHLAAMMPIGRFPTQWEVRQDNSVFGPHGEKGGYTPPMTRFDLPFTLYTYGKEDKPVNQQSGLEHALIR